jgi:gluconolactonase
MIRLKSALNGVCVLLTLTGISFSPLPAQDSVTGDDSIVFPGSTVELLFEGAYFTEGPAVGPDGMVYFSDITITSNTGMQAGHIWRFNPKSGEAEVYRSPSGMANGIIFDAGGRMIVAEQADFGGRRITATDLVSGKAVILAGLYDGNPLNSPNDLALDEKGRVYFTDPRYLGHEHEPVAQPVDGVYRIDPDGALTLLSGEIAKPNGILVSPDQRTLYVAALGGGENAIFAFDLAEDGSVGERQTFIDFTPGRGPDGMAIDVEGNIYAARTDQPRGIYVYSPEGRHLATIPTPRTPRNVTFGRGDDSRSLYITAGGELYKLEVKKEGYHAGKW